MNQTKAPKSTPPAKGGTTHSDILASERNSQADFLSAALNMGWQLAIVVLVPVVGGYKLDTKFNSLPALTIVGLVIASVGTGLILHRQLQRFNVPYKAAKKTKGQNL
jgi:hypothetical protein